MPSVRPAEALVQHRRDFGERAVGDLARNLDEHRAHHAAVEREHHEQTLTAHAHQLEPAEHRAIEARSERDAELLRQHAERLRGAAKNRLDRRRAVAGDELLGEAVGLRRA